MPIFWFPVSKDLSDFQKENPDKILEPKEFIEDVEELVPQDEESDD